MKSKLKRQVIKLDDKEIAKAIASTGIHKTVKSFSGYSKKYKVKRVYL